MAHSQTHTNRACQAVPARLECAVGMPSTHCVTFTQTGDCANLTYQKPGSPPAPPVLTTLARGSRVLYCHLSIEPLEKCF